MARGPDFSFPAPQLHDPGHRACRQQLAGLRVDGPSIHTFKEPLAGATVDATLPLMVKWSADGADSAAIDAENLDRLSIPDTGSYSVAAGALKSEKDKARAERSRRSRCSCSLKMRPS